MHLKKHFIRKEYAKDPKGETYIMLDNLVKKIKIAKRKIS